ncbi:MAG TPA: YceI family protein [bacterium]|nr:YceI family protein [bacterium]
MRWTIDPVHSSIEFAILHMSISKIRGRFRKLRGVIETSDDGVLQTINLMIEAGSIDTGDSRRDAHLISPDFLDAAQHPSLVFRSTKVDALGNGRYRVGGTTTIRGRTRPMTIEVATTNPVTDAEGNRRAGARAEGRLSRMDWGLTWNSPLPWGGLLVGDTVWFTIDVEAVAFATVAVA